VVWRREFKYKGNIKNMKQKFGKQFALVPVGLLVISIAIAISQLTHLPDALKGLLFGIGIGLTMLPILLNKINPI
jgi:uncharacterized membrane protein